MSIARWAGIVRPYNWADVKRLQGRTKIKHSFAENGANRLWSLINSRPFVAALGASTLALKESTESHQF